MLDTSSGKRCSWIFSYLQYGSTGLMRLYSEKYSRKEEALERLRNGDSWDVVVEEYAEHSKKTSEYLDSLLSCHRGQTLKLLI